jgi:hypothetical protein
MTKNPQRQAVDKKYLGWRGTVPPAAGRAALSRANDAEKQAETG